MRAILVLGILLAGCAQEKAANDTALCVSVPVDGDGDGYASEDTVLAVCGDDIDGLNLADLPPATDCDDGDAAINPGAVEIADDGVDNNCDGEIDEAGPDADGDGYSASAGNCDDTSSAIYPGAEEICDGVDNNCDGQIDEDTAKDAATWFADGDGDGYGDAATSVTACSAPAGYVADDTDCDDTSSAVYPGADEVCNGIDDDCDGLVDEEDDSLTGATWYADDDGDGFGAGPAIRSCEALSGYASSDTDCVDTDDTVYPGAPELCDEQSNDCDTASAWTTSEEYGTATFFPDSGSAEDLSYTLSKTSGTVTDYAISEDGTLMLCGDPGDPTIWYVNLSIDGLNVGITGYYGLGSATLSGGGTGTIVDAYGSDLDVDSITLTGGAGVSYGGAIHAHYTNLTIQDCLITENTAPNGGGIFADTGYTTIKDSTFTDNYAGNFGGAVFVNAYSMLLDSVAMTLNSSDGDGGALYIKDTAAVAISGSSTFTANKALSGRGGGIAVYARSTVRLGDTTTVDGNSGRWGGGLSVAYGSDLELNGTVSVTNNTAQYGGGVAMDNSATYSGAASSVEVLNGASVSDNGASLYGGGMYLYGGYLTLTDAAIADNSSEYDGGGVWAQGVVDITCQGETGATPEQGVVGNTSAYGGGIWAGDSTTLHATTCDLGNDPDDVYTSGSATPYTYGDDATFTCDSSGCY